MVVLAMKTLIALHGVSSHLIWLLEVWLILYFLQDLVHKLPKHSTNYLGSSRSSMPSKISLGPIVVVPLRSESLWSWGTTLALPFPCCWSSPTYLYSSIWSMSWHTLLAGFLVKDFLKSCLAGKPTLKVLIVTSSKFPSISLKISQYLSEYVFRVSPSRMAIDSKESKGRGTLLQVTKWAPKALVSSWKELIDPSPNPPNHLIVTGPKFYRNTLHIKVSFFEWTTIFWLKWLTCSIGFVLPLYMVNVGWINHRGSFPPSILRVNGDLEIWCKALLIASLPRPLRDGLLLLRL